MDSVSSLDSLNADPRPSCVIDLRRRERDTEPYVEFINKALQEQKHLLLALQNQEGNHPGVKATLWAWTSDGSENAGESAYFESIDGYNVYGFTIKRRWRVVQWQRTQGSVDHSEGQVGNGPLRQGTRVVPLMNEKTAHKQEQDPVTLIRGLSSLFERSVGCRDTESFWTQLVAALMAPAHGCLFAFVYSLPRHSSTQSAEYPGQGSSSEYHMASAQGCEAAGLALPRNINLATSNSCFASVCLRAQTLVEPLDLEKRELESFQNGDNAYHHSLDPSNVKAVLCPVIIRGEKVATGFIVVGVESGVASSQLSRSWLMCVATFASVRVQSITNAEQATIATGAHESKSRVLQDALADRNDVTEKLASTLSMIEMVDVGMFDYDTNGVLLHANEAFYKLSGHPKGPAATSYSWTDCVFPEDKEMTFMQWDKLSNGVASTFEMRWKRPAAHMLGGEEDLEGQWVLAACVPTKNEAGEVTTISGCITDIAAQKRSESDARNQAEALKRAHASEKRFTRFAEAAPVGIYIVDIEGKVGCPLLKLELEA